MGQSGGDEGSGGCSGVAATAEAATEEVEAGLGVWGWGWKRKWCEWDQSVTT